MSDLFKKHIWMVYSRPSQEERANMKECGLQNVDDWTPILSRPVWYNRASWLARDKENKFTEIKIERVA